MTRLSIDVAPVFEPLLAPSRYKGAWGGRGSGKSQFFADAIIIEALKRPGLRVFTCPIANNDNSFSPEALAIAARDAGAEAEAHQGFEAAMKAAVRAGAERILICGSLYLAGKVLALNEELPA